MRAILLGRGGFWIERDVEDCPSTLRLPFFRPYLDMFAPDSTAKLPTATLNFSRLAVANPWPHDKEPVVIYAQVEDGL